MKTKYGREIKPVEKFQNISFVPGSGVSGCDQYDSECEFSDGKLQCCYDY